MPNPAAGSFLPTSAQISAILAKTASTLTVRELAILAQELRRKANTDPETTLSTLLP